MTKPTIDDSSSPARRPAAFAVEPSDTAAKLHSEQPRRKPQSFDTEIVLTPDEDDPFINPDIDPVLAAGVGAKPRRRGFSFGKVALSALGILISLAFGLWTDQLIRNLFSRADWLGYTALAVVAIGILAVIAIVIRETAGMMRLAAVQTIKTEAEAAILETRPARAKALVKRLCTVLEANPETARGRATLKAAEDDIIDAPQLIDLAERELLGPLDRRARALILGASKRVSVVTAVSPRALVDILYVLYEASKLVRAMAELYGGRPGTLGMMRLMRDVLAHLAVTGSIAVGDSIVQQLIGHGLASKLSARLGEGVVNGMMTARIGIAAMDLCRPLSFKALKRPGIADFAGDLTPKGAGRPTT
ncbi:TIGR01620 family protein [Rhizobium sp. P38BS-XIX]|uniref:YcjF family protein n=1 Tax=Rhizobium sp. P38BS-XIX TaxID=2726740 RepID=UPI00145658C3|nr:TIGR01620 family protein [Rhizobium sp. P38BS-XIX]NLR96264.1 TIGR01620 family protein [Rhizobium sp. P38BS-XIX]